MVSYTSPMNVGTLVAPLMEVFDPVAVALAAVELRQPELDEVGSQAVPFLCIACSTSLPGRILQIQMSAV